MESALEVRTEILLMSPQLTFLTVSHPSHIHPSTIFSSRETFVEREPGESANDRNDRAIRVATAWYCQHLKTSKSDAEGLKVVLLTNDIGNKQKGEESGLLVYKCMHEDFLFPL